MGALEFFMIGLYGFLKFLFIVLQFLFFNPIGWIILIVLFLISIFNN